MIWTAPPEKNYDNEALEKRLWAAADQLRANSGLTSGGQDGFSTTESFH